MIGRRGFLQAVAGVVAAGCLPSYEWLLPSEPGIPRGPRFVTWNPSTDFNFSNPVNWAGGFVPREGDTIVFDGTSGDMPACEITPAESVFVKASYRGRIGEIA